MHKQILRVLYIILGTCFLILGLIGILLPGLPTTPFLLLTAFFYIRSSKKLYSWLLNHKFLRKYIYDFVEHKSMPLNSKIFAILMMIVMVSLSVIFFIETVLWKMIVAGLGIIGIMVVLSIPTTNSKSASSG